MMNNEGLSSKQQAMVKLWEEHVSAEFERKDVEGTMATMTANPFVNNVAVMLGGVGAAQVRQFYRDYFLAGHPPDTKTTPVARTVGADRLIDEVIFSCTHTIEMPWILPGIKPTGKHLEFAIIVVVQFQDGKISGERIYWDQASVLAQVGLIDAGKLPVMGARTARKVLNPAAEPSNELIDRAGGRHS